MVAGAVVAALGAAKSVCDHDHVRGLDDRRGPELRRLAWMAVTTLAAAASMMACQAPGPSATGAPATVAGTTSTTPPSTAPTAPPSPSSTPALSAPGSTTLPPVAAADSLGSTVLALVDHSRATVSHGRLIASSRTLTTMVWYPSGPVFPRALIVFAHGYSVGLTPYVRVCEMWARAGFVVAAPVFPLTDKAVAGAALDESDIVHQPADVRFVITALLAANAAPGGRVSGMIDPQRIAAAGHSDGADTALDVTYLPGDRDPRIRAAVVDAPDPLPLPAGAAKVVSSVPLLLVHGDHDPIAPFSGSLRVLTQLSAPGWFLVLRGADHLSPIQGPSGWTKTLDKVTTDFLTNAFTNPVSLNATLTTDIAGAPVTLQRLG